MAVAMGACYVYRNFNTGFVLLAPPACIRYSGNEIRLNFTED